MQTFENRIVKLAVVGAGDMGRRQMRAIQAEPGCVLAAVVDPFPRVAEVGETQPVPVYSELDTMCDALPPDGIIIATPNHLHVPQALRCIHRGIPVLVEKPISDSVADALDLADTAEALRVPVLVGHHRRHNPIIRTARKVVREGRLGVVTSVSALWLLCKPDGYFAVDWRRQPGGGPILINLIHDIDSLRFVVGDITAVQAITSNARRGFRVEDSAAILLRFENGALGTVTLSDVAPSPWNWELTSGEVTSYRYPQTGEDSYRIAGTDGALAIPSMRLWRYPEEKSWTNVLDETSVPVTRADPLRAQLRHFINVVNGAATPLVGARDAARTLKVTLAVSEAARLGREVPI